MKNWFRCALVRVCLCIGSVRQCGRGWMELGGVWVWVCVCVVSQIKGVITPKWNIYAQIFMNKTSTCTHLIVILVRARNANGEWNAAVCYTIHSQRVKTFARKQIFNIDINIYFIIIFRRALSGASTAYPHARIQPCTLHVGAGMSNVKHNITSCMALPMHSHSTHMFPNSAQQENGLFCSIAARQMW